MKKNILKLSAYAMLMGVIAMPFLSCSKGETGGEKPTQPTKPTDSGTSTDSNIDDLMPLSSGATYSSKTTMGVFFQSLKTATSDDLSWLNNPSQEPSLPKGKENSLFLKPFTVNLYPYGVPSPADCNQTALGDCSAISVFAELAYINPAFIKSLITDNKDNSYTVNMFDPQGKPIKVTVSNKFMANNNGGIVAVTGKSSIPTWSTIMEKALMKYIDVFKLVNTIEGIGSEYASPPFTGDGNSFAFSPNKLTAVQLKKAVDVSLAQGKIVIGGFTQSDVNVGASKTVSAHAWAFMYPPVNSLNQALFVMRNPWGNNNGSDLDGLMYIPNDQKITLMIDLRIINPGSAKASTKPSIYTPPKY